MTEHRGGIRMCALAVALVLMGASCAKDAPGGGPGGSGPGITAKPFRTLKVPGDHPTIQKAVDAAKAGDLVLIDAGVYKEEVVVQTDDLVIRGRDRNKVILDGEFTRDNGIKVFSNGVAVENLTARNYKGNGVFFTGDYDSNFVLNGYRASYITTYNNGDYGVYAFNATRGQFDHLYGSGHPDSAFYIGQCKPCDAVVTDSIGENNFLGYSGTNSTGVKIVNSTWRRNRIGISPQSQEGEKLAPNEGGLIAGNNVYDNNNPNTPQKDPDLDVAYQTGIVAAGTDNYVITKNRVVNNKKANIVVILWPFGQIFLPHGNRVTDNVTSGAETYGDIILALLDTNEGTLANCFAGNTFATSRPPDLEKTVAPCSGPGAKGFEPLDVAVLAASAPAPADYKTMAPPPDQPTMPGVDAPPLPAGAGWQPIAVDLDKIQVPTKD